MLLENFQILLKDDSTIGLIFDCCEASSTPRQLGSLKGKGERNSCFLSLPLFPLTFTQPHLTFLGWQTTRVHFYSFLPVRCSVSL
jgi:hypothetical protein